MFQRTISHRQSSYSLINKSSNSKKQKRQHTTGEWPGIECDPRSRFVVKVKLLSENLIGTLSTEIGFRTRLQTINLIKNAMSSVIDPVIFYNPPRLISIDASENKFGGGLSKSLPHDIAYSKTLGKIFLINSGVHEDRLIKRLIAYST